VPPRNEITVAIIEDNRLVCEALAAMLNRLPDIRVVGSFDVYPASLVETNPGVLLLDAGLRDYDSLSVAVEVMTELPNVRIIVMDIIPMNEEIAAFVNAGVCGFVLKDASFDEFVETIRSVAQGGKVLPPRMADSLFAQITKQIHGPGTERTFEDVRMTRREREVIGLIGEGLSNKEIAKRLNVATHTVKSHVRNVMEKLALHTRLQIAAYSHKDRTA
jgi:DNA-binding NarL/FixJ family response regulator